ncbi:unnamed protein product [Phytophthora fragariaefolia]|uniref:Unnamed protein product n=1 Tax=Phytophthora fragariaefolia TaxID=1490495 RepID=A0A9W6XPV7_9STRA|nr:unnamed protein product [Phytophthora fragariaefolia]
MPACQSDTVYGGAAGGRGQGGFVPHPSYRWNAFYANPSTSAEPTALGYVEDTKAEVHAVEQRRGIRQCFVCGDTRTCLISRSGTFELSLMSVKGCAVPGPYRKVVLCVTAARIIRAEALLRTRTLVRLGETRSPSNTGRPTEEELSYVEHHAGGGQQGLAPKGAVLSNMKRVCKPDLLVFQVPVKGFELRCLVERCLDLGLDAKCVLILGTWLERHEPRMDWRSKNFGAMHFSLSGALASHESASARKQKHFWRFDLLSRAFTSVSIGVAMILTRCTSGWTGSKYLGNYGITLVVRLTGWPACERRRQVTPVTAPAEPLVVSSAPLPNASLTPSNPGLLRAPGPGPDMA